MTHIRSEMTTFRLPLELFFTLPDGLLHHLCHSERILDTAITVGWSTKASKAEKVASPVEKWVRQARNELKLGLGLWKIHPSPQTPYPGQPPAAMWKAGPQGRATFPQGLENPLRIFHSRPPTKTRGLIHE